MQRSKCLVFTNTNAKRITRNYALLLVERRHYAMLIETSDSNLYKRPENAAHVYNTIQTLVVMSTAHCDD